MMKLKRVAIFLVLVALAVWIGIRFFASDAQEVVKSELTQTVPVPRGSIVKVVESSGSLAVRKEADLGFALAGQLQKVHVQRGERVNSGEVLAELDNAQQELALIKAESAYQIAKIEGIPNTVREREIDREIARTNLERTQLQAPFSGMVVDVPLEAGESVSANSVVVQLMDDSRYYVEVLVDELDMGRIALGQQARVEVDALSPLVIDGEVVEIGLRAQSSGGVVTVPVKIRLETDNPQVLKPGYSASVQIVVAHAKDVLMVPVEAIAYRGGQAMVTVLRNGEQKPVNVETGLSNGLDVEITAGLTENDQIVLLNYGFHLQQRGANSFGGVPMGNPRMFR